MTGKHEKSASTSNNALHKNNKRSEPTGMQHIVKENINSISIIDKNGTILLVFLGVKIGNLVGRNVRDLNELGIYEMSTSERAFKNGKTVTDLVKSKFGTQQIVTSTPLRDAGGNITMVVNTALDRSLLNRLEQALKDNHGNTEQLNTVINYLSDLDNPHEIPIAESPQMRQIITTIRTIAKTDSNIILAGESGTGKEVMARYIHKNSLRAKKPFIPVNCASIPRELMESEFFGYVRGAFTGASPQGKPGLFELAHDGTLFLDEIAELPLEMQPKLLRVLENGEIQRVGGTSPIQTNVRIISATNKDLKSMINQKLFRSDLYYRLNVVPIHIPSLRERPEDLIALADNFLEKMNYKYDYHKKFAPQTIQAFLNYSWPGNVRELRNMIERLVITSSDDYLVLDEDFLEGGNTHLKPESQFYDTEEKSVYKGTLKNYLGKIEEAYIQDVLEECGGKVGEAAERLGIHRTMLYRKLKQHRDL
ncbi:MAG: sigma-54 interaction domain-containing protein [Dehalobacterium sp.]